MPEILYVDGVPIQALGLSVLRVGAAWSPAPLERSYLSVPGRIGAVPLERATSRELRIPVEMRLASTVDGRPARRDAVMRLWSGAVHLVWSDAPDRYQSALLDVAAHRALTETPWVQGDLVLEAEIVVPDGVSWSIQPTVLSLPAGVPVPVTLGTATAAPLVIVPGPWTDLHLAYRHPSGQELASLQLYGSITGDERIEIDARHERLVVEDVTTGARLLRMDLYGAGSWPVLDPHDAVGSVPTALPQLVCSVDGVAIYRQAWR